MLCAAALTSPSMPPTRQNPSEIARISFEALQEGDLKAWFPMHRFAKPTSKLSPTCRRRRTEEPEDSLNTTDGFGKAHDAKTPEYGAVIKMQKQGKRHLDGAQKKSINTRTPRSAHQENIKAISPPLPPLPRTTVTRRNDPFKKMRQSLVSQPRDLRKTSARARYGQPKKH